MSENIEQAFDSLSEQTKKYDIALFYVKGDKEKAKDMVTGIYHDVYAIKTTFSASSIYGAFIMFFNIPYATLIDSYIIVSSSYEVDDIKSKVTWREFEQDVEDSIKKCNVDEDLTRKLREALNKSFTIQMEADQRAVELKKLLDIDDEIAINRLFSRFIQDKLEYQLMDISVDYQTTSSLDIELYSTSSKKASEDEIKKVKEDEQRKSLPQAEEIKEPENELDGKDVQLILDAELMLAPIKGKAISSIIIGDRIKVSLDASNHKAVSVARAFKCYNDEEQVTLPMTARVVSVRHLMDGGYKIFGVIAKGIYVKIVEEEDNIKIAMDYDQVNGNVEHEEVKSSSKLQIILIVVIAVLILVGVVVIVLK